MLAGRLDGTAPYGWTGTGPDVEHHLVETFRLLGGRGPTSQELTALTAYVAALPSPPPARADAAKIARGAALFASRETKCSTCHVPESGFTDHAKHDVGSAAGVDRERAFDTPSLRSIAGTAPYFHDGRYATLRDLLIWSGATMGHTDQLSNDEVDALEAYLASL